MAIIAILIAVSIPLVNNSLERAREATDAANERAFKAELSVCYLQSKYTNESGEQEFTPGAVYKYDAANGILTTGNIDNGYGKSTKIKGVDEKDRTGMVLFGTVDASTGMVKMKWADKSANASTDTITNGTDLISPGLANDNS